MYGKLLCTLATVGTLAAPTLADTLDLTGVARDFKRGDRDGGHPDFETATRLGGFGLVHGLVTYQLSEDGKPVYNSTRPSNDTVYSPDSFAQWYRDVPDVNVAVPLTLTLDNGRQGPGGVYTFSSNAFWPIDSQMFGNQGLNHNFHFTFELHTEFTYQPGQTFTFIGDDDVWVYVNRTRIIDLGGVHSAETGRVLLFDGKAFVEKNHFPKGGIVQEVSSTLATQLAKNWSALGLSGDCPIRRGDRYIDLNLNEGHADTRVKFADSSAQVYASRNLSSVVLKFADGSEQTFDGISSGTNGTFAGTGAHQGKAVVGAWVAAGDVSGAGTYHAADGSSSIECTLDFFFAERHTTQANFRIDTSIPLTTVPPTTISPLYD